MELEQEQEPLTIKFVLPVQEARVHERKSNQNTR
jgi:hypothetical protein